MVAPASSATARETDCRGGEEGASGGSAITGTAEAGARPACTGKGGGTSAAKPSTAVVELLRPELPSQTADDAPVEVLSLTEADFAALVVQTCSCALRSKYISSEDSQDCH